MSVCNAVAAGMMLSASYSLVTEGVSAQAQAMAPPALARSHTKTNVTCAHTGPRRAERMCGSIFKSKRSNRRRMRTDPCSLSDPRQLIRYAYGTLCPPPLPLHQVALDSDSLTFLDVPISHTIRVGLGILLGIVFVVGTKSYVESNEEFTLGDNLTGLEAAKVMSPQN